jgi:hypothetical protein
MSDANDQGTEHFFNDTLTEIIGSVPTPGRSRVLGVYRGLFCSDKTRIVIWRPRLTVFPDGVKWRFATKPAGDSQRHDGI